MKLLATEFDDEKDEEKERERGSKGGGSIHGGNDVEEQFGGCGVRRGENVTCSVNETTLTTAGDTEASFTVLNSRNTHRI